MNEVLTREKEPAVYIDGKIFPYYSQSYELAKELQNKGEIDSETKEAIIQNLIKVRVHEITLNNNHAGTQEKEGAKEGINNLLLEVQEAMKGIVVCENN